MQLVQVRIIDVVGGIKGTQRPPRALLACMLASLKRWTARKRPCRVTTVRGFHVLHFYYTFYVTSHIHCYVSM